MIFKMQLKSIDANGAVTAIIWEDTGENKINPDSVELVKIEPTSYHNQRIIEMLIKDKVKIDG